MKRIAAFVLFIGLAAVYPATAKPPYYLALQMSPAGDGTGIIGIPLDADPNGKVLPILTFQCSDHKITARPWNLAPVTAALNAHKTALSADGAALTDSEAGTLLEGLCGNAHAQDARNGETLTALNVVAADGSLHPVPPQQ
jgi:hypothetical protein